ncbi:MULTISPECIES: FAD/NAD(P)-binding protein [Micrococcaceae]|uniref:FAD/NAD(P)-binding protein n=1 Tax=unclassified Kocuria TaxID=2649579 RepID=UPI0013EC01A1|nr:MULTISPECIES: FAD/NAD(P)-binding protein [unclassified Kocuria]
MPTSIVFVGGGPKTTGVLLALAASMRPEAPALDDPVDVHVIEPFEAGGGRIWRHEQSPTLWMNSVARDVTIFADQDASLTAPPLTGPDLATWVEGAGRNVLEERGLGDYVEGFTPESFAPRQVQAAYLAWAFDRAVESMPDAVHVHVHRSLAVKVLSSGDRRSVFLESSSNGSARIDADVVVLAQGFVEIEDDAETRMLKTQAEELGLSYIAPGYTADVDLSGLEPGQDVLVRGFGLAFIDAMMMVTEDRGGVFQSSGARTRYRPSGREPVLWVGSRRGVPYHSKLGYLPKGMRVGPTRYVTKENFARLADDAKVEGPGRLTVLDDVMPLLDMELFVAHYSELAYRHPQRAEFAPDDIRDRGDEWSSIFLAGNRSHASDLRNELDRWAQSLVPDPRDHYDLARIDRPFAARDFDGREDVEQAVSDYVRGDLDRAADPSYSQDSARFHALVGAYYVVRELVAHGEFSAEDRIQNFDAGLHGLFSFIASGPPPERLENLLALHREGLVRFLGPEVRVCVHDGAFEAASPAYREVVRTRSMFDARLARVSAKRAKDTLLRDLIRQGDLKVESQGGMAAKFLIDENNRALDSRGVPQDDLLMVGPSVAGSVEEAFSRPGTDAHVFRDNERLAQRLREFIPTPSTARIL